MDSTQFFSFSPRRSRSSSFISLLHRLLVTGAFLLCAGVLGVAGSVKAQDINRASDDSEAYGGGNFTDENNGGGFGSSYKFKDFGTNDQGGEFLEGSGRQVESTQSLGLFSNTSGSGVAVSRPFSDPIRGAHRFTFNVRFDVPTTTGETAGFVFNETATGSQSKWNDGQRLFLGIDGDGDWKYDSGSGTVIIGDGDGGNFVATGGKVYKVTLILEPNEDRFVVQVENLDQGTSSETVSGTLDGTSGEPIRSFGVGNGVIGNNNNVIWDVTDLDSVVNIANGSIDTKSSIDKAITDASGGRTVAVGPGTRTEEIIVDKSLTFRGPWSGTPGANGSRGTNEAVIDAGTSSQVDQNANIAFNVQEDDVTIDGFELTGNQGVVLDPSRFSMTNEGVGLNVKNNLVTTDIVGVGIQNVTTAESKSFTIADNQFELGRQSFDLVDSQETSLGGDGDNTEGDEVFEYTASVGIQTIDGDQAPTIQNNVVTDDGNSASPDGDPDGSFYGYAIDGLKVNSRTTIAGDPGNTGNTGTIQGTAQGIAVLDGQSPAQSNVSIEDFSISAMSGSAPNSGAVNFQAGVFSFTEDDVNGNTTTVHISNTSIEGLDFSDPKGNPGANPSANIYLGSFDFGDSGTGTAKQDVMVEGVTIQNTEHRGISLDGNAAQNISATITDDADGNNTVVKEIDAGNDAHPIHSENGGSLTINNAEVINKDISAADAFHIRDAGATITFGDDVTINSNGRTTFGDLGGRLADADVEVTSTTSLSTIDLDLGGTLELTGSETLRVTDRLILTSGTFDVSSGTLTLASSGNASTAFVSGSGSGTLTGDVTVEWQVPVPSGPSSWDGWQALTAPVAAPLDGTADALLSNMWTQKSGSGTGYDAANNAIDNSSVFDYDETATVGGSTTEDLNDAWFTPSDISTPITQGQTGRLVFFFADRDFDSFDESGSAFTLSATGALLDKENTNADVGLDLAFTDDSDDDSANGWNLVGNPFMAPIDWELMTDDGAGRSNVSRTVYIPKANGNYASYQADNSGTSGSSNNGGTRYLSPFQGFFVKATGGTPSLDLKSSDKVLNQSPTLKRNGESAPKVKLHMQAEKSSRDEDTVVRFSDGAAMDASDGDAYQLTPFGSDHFYIASEIDGESSAYEIQSLPKPGSDVLTVPLVLASTNDRTYTIGSTLSGMPEDWKVQLKDRETGTTADLRAGETLTVSLDGSSESTTNEASRKSSTAQAPSTLRAGEPLVAKASESSTATSKADTDDSARFVLEVTGSDPLPVELTRFDGQARDDAIELSWTTASETNNAGFRVQRRTAETSGDPSSSGTGQWTSLGFVDGEGTTTAVQRYRFTDSNMPYQGETLTYRLKQIDTDGSTQFSDPIEVERGAPSAVRLQSVFPNPARTRATVRYELPQASDVTLALYDVLGRRVATVVDASQDAGRKQIEVPVSSLSSGVHFLRLRAGQTVQTRKLVVTK